MLDLRRLPEMIRYEQGVSRRLFLAYAASLTSVPLLGRSAKSATRRPQFSADPFSVGVASGDPTDTASCCGRAWRPSRSSRAAGWRQSKSKSRGKSRRTTACATCVQRGTSIATPQLGHSVHVEVDGLEPDRWYWYRFRAGDAESPVGRTRTMPAADAIPAELRFAFASCQHFEHGLLHGVRAHGQGRARPGVSPGRLHLRVRGQKDETGFASTSARKSVSLDDYRIRHAQYKTDPLLQAMHARCPWMVVWDDHEFDNNYANDISEEAGVDPAEFLIRRANAYQAYYEMMPLRGTSLPRGPHMQLYRKLSFGRLAEFLVLDTRQYRTDQPNDDRDSRLNEDAMSPKSSMLGARQRDWLQKSLVESPGSWNVLAQQVMMGMVGPEGRRGAVVFDGSVARLCPRASAADGVPARSPGAQPGRAHRRHSFELGERPAGRRPPGRDARGRHRVRRHSDLQRRRRRRTSRKTRIRSWPRTRACRFFNRQRGYVRCTVTPDQWRSDYRVLQRVTRPTNPIDAGIVCH